MILTRTMLLRNRRRDVATERLRAYAKVCREG